MSKPVHDLLEALDRIDAPDLWDSITASADSAPAQESVDDPMIVDLRQGGELRRSDETTPDRVRTRRAAVVIAVAAAVLVVVGVVVTDGNSGSVVTDAVSSPTVTAPVTPSEQAKVFGDGGEARQELASVIAAGPGLVAVGNLLTAQTSTAAVWTSVDGITWSRSPHDQAVFGPTIKSVVVGGPGLVAVGHMSQTDDFMDPGSAAVVWTSVDGITWSLVPHDEAIFGGPGNQNLNGVTAGGPGLVAVGADGGGYGRSVDAAVWTSVDGITWSRVRHDEAVFGGTRMNSVTVGGPGLVAVGSTGVGGDNSTAIFEFDDSNPMFDAVVWTSVDGITWSRVPHDEAIFGGPGAQRMNKVIAAGPGLVAVGIDSGGDSVDAAVWTSVDGITWSRVPDDEAIFGGAGWDEMSDVTVGGPGLVAVGFDGLDSDDADEDSADGDAAVWTSADGITWDRVPHDEEVFGGAGSQSMRGVTATNRTLVAVGRDGTGAYDEPVTVQAAVWTSTDGITWSRVAPDQTIDEANQVEEQS